MKIQQATLHDDCCWIFSLCCLSTTNISHCMLTCPVNCSECIWQWNMPSLPYLLLHRKQIVRPQTTRLSKRYPSLVTLIKHWCWVVKTFLSLLISMRTLWGAALINFLALWASRAVKNYETQWQTHQKEKKMHLTHLVPLLPINRSGWKLHWQQCWNQK